MKEFGLVMAVLVVFTLAVKQAAFILLYGSVFQWLRDGIKDRLDQSHDFQYEDEFRCRVQYWFWSKAHELFTCNLCMTAQISIWLCAVPVTTMVHLRWSHPLEQFLLYQLNWSLEVLGFGFMTFVVAMTVASSAMAWWGLVEYLPTRLVAEKDFMRKKLEQELEASTANQQQLATMMASMVKSTQPRIDWEDFHSIIQRLEMGCDDIGCGIRRRECRIDTLDNVVGEYARENQLPRTFAQKLKEALERVIKTYNDQKRHYSRSERQEFQRELYERLVSQLG